MLLVTLHLGTYPCCSYLLHAQLATKLLVVTVQT